MPRGDRLAATVNGRAASRRRGPEQDAFDSRDSSRTLNQPAPRAVERELAARSPPTGMLVVRAETARAASIVEFATHRRRGRSRSLSSSLSQRHARPDELCHDQPLGCAIRIASGTRATWSPHHVDRSASRSAASSRWAMALVSVSRPRVVRLRRDRAADSARARPSPAGQLPSHHVGRRPRDVPAARPRGTWRARREHCPRQQRLHPWVRRSRMAARPRPVLHFTPASTSCLSLVERWLAD